MKIGNSEIEKLYIGEDEVGKLYLGTDIIYEKGSGSDYRTMPLTFEILSGGNIVWKAFNAAFSKTIEYSKNDGEWTSITSATGSSAPTISVVSGDTVQFRGNNANYGTSINDSNSFEDTTCGFKVKGNIMSLINSTDFANLDTLQSGCTFNKLFNVCTGLTDASNLVLPATTLAEGCYDCMFHYCSSLSYIKCLATTDLTQGVYTASWVEGVPNSGGDDSSDASSPSSSSDEPVPFEGGTFVKHPDNDSWGFGISDIPNGWTVEDAVL